MRGGVSVVGVVSDVVVCVSFMARSYVKPPPGW